MFVIHIGNVKKYVCIYLESCYRIEERSKLKMNELLFIRSHKVKLSRKMVIIYLPQTPLYVYVKK